MQNQKASGNSPCPRVSVVGLRSRRRRQGRLDWGPHLAKTLEPRVFSGVAAGFSSYDGDLSLPLGLALGSPIFPSGCEGQLGVAYNIIYEMSHQSRFDAGYWMLGAGALGGPRGMVRGGRREEGSGWGTHVHPWQIHVDVWQNQYNIVIPGTGEPGGLLSMGSHRVRQD